jgi:Fe-S-cluster containining protein
VPECLACGTCCYSPSHEYVWVNGADWTRLGADAERLAHFIGNRAFMKMQDGHCIALDIRRRPDGTREFFCTIYEQRPQICHALGRGSPECESVLVEAGKI